MVAVVARNMAEVECEQVQWVWSGRIPLGMLTVLDGQPKAGKSTVVADLVARVTTGTDMPDNTKSDLHGPACVLYLTAEDDLATVLKPRLDAAGADCNQVLAMGPTDNLPTIPAGVADITKLIVQHEAKMLVLDTLSGSESSGTSFGDTRRARPAVRLCLGRRSSSGTSTALFVRRTKGMAGVESGPSDASWCLRRPATPRPDDARTWGWRDG